MPLKGRCLLIHTVAIEDYCYIYIGTHMLWKYQNYKSILNICGLRFESKTYKKYVICKIEYDINQMYGLSGYEEIFLLQYSI